MSVISLKAKCLRQAYFKSGEFEGLDDCFHELCDNLFALRLSVNSMRDMVLGEGQSRYASIYSDAEQLLRNSNECIDYMKKVMAC